jgi:transposase
MKPLALPAWTAEHVEAVARLSRTTPHVRRRTRAQMVLLAAEQQLGVRASAARVRACAGTVRGWRKRARAQGSDGRQDQWAGGAPAQVPPASRDQLQQLVRRRPRRLTLPSSPGTRHRRAAERAERTGVRGEQEPVRVPLQAVAMVVRRPHHPRSSPDPDSAGNKGRVQQPATPAQPGRSAPAPMRALGGGSPRCGPGGAPRATRCCCPLLLRRPSTTAWAPAPLTRGNRWAASSGTSAATRSPRWWKRSWTPLPAGPSLVPGRPPGPRRRTRSRSGCGQQRDGGWCGPSPLPPRAQPE